MPLDLDLIYSYKNKTDDLFHVYKTFVEAQKATKFITDSQREAIVDRLSELWSAVKELMIEEDRPRKILVVRVTCASGVKFGFRVSNGRAFGYWTY